MAGRAAIRRTRTSPAASATRPSSRMCVLRMVDMLKYDRSGVPVNPDAAPCRKLTGGASRGFQRHVYRQLVNLSLSLVVLLCKLILKNLFVSLEDGALVITSLLLEIHNLDLVDPFSETVAPSLQFRKLLHPGK